MLLLLSLLLLWSFFYFFYQQSVTRIKQVCCFVDVDTNVGVGIRTILAGLMLKLILLKNIGADHWLGGRQAEEAQHLLHVFFFISNTKRTVSNIFCVYFSFVWQLNNFKWSFLCLYRLKYVSIKHLCKKRNNLFNNDSLRGSTKWFQQSDLFVLFCDALKVCITSVPSADHHPSTGR